MRFKFGQKLLDLCRGKCTFRKRNIAKSAVFKVKGKLELDKTAEIKEGVVIQCGKDAIIKIGKLVQLNPYVILYGGNITIGDYTMIAPHAVIVVANHDFIQTEIPMRLAGSISKNPGGGGCAYWRRCLDWGKLYNFGWSPNW